MSIVMLCYRCRMIRCVVINIALVCICLNIVRFVERCCITESDSLSRETGFASPLLLSRIRDNGGESVSCLLRGENFLV